MLDTKSIFTAQKDFFISGQTKDIRFRIAQLDILHKASNGLVLIISPWNYPFQLLKKIMR